MWLLPAILVGAVFGAGDQLLGSVATWPWSWQVAGISAQWLVVPFVMGATQRRVGRALVVGGACALSAVAAYVAMILSPMEGVHLTPPVAQISTTLVSQWPWFAGAAVVAPLYGLLGSRWRTHGSVVSLAVAVGTIWLEPLARSLTGRLQPDAVVWVGELGCGGGVAVLAATWALAVRRRTAA